MSAALVSDGVRRHPSVISGIGVVAPNGVGRERFWSACLRGEHGIRTLDRSLSPRYPLKVAGLVADAGPVPARLAVQTDRWTHLAFVACEEALADAGLQTDELDPARLSVILATASGGTEFGQREMQGLYTGGPRRVTVWQSIAWFYAASTGQLSIRHGAKGPSSAIAAEQAGAIQALGEARRQVGRADLVVISGGTDASLCPYGQVAQVSSGRISTAADPLSAFLPFDERSTGAVPGEGGAILVVERDAGARDRRVRPYATVAGICHTYGATDPCGRSLVEAMRGALADAALRPEDIDIIFADGSGVRNDDDAEATALAEVFADRIPTVALPKALFGRLYAGSATDLAAAALAIRDQQIPSAGQQLRPRPSTRLTVHTGPARPCRIEAVMVLARGYPGFTSVAILTRPSEARTS